MPYFVVAILLTILAICATGSFIQAYGRSDAKGWAAFWVTFGLFVIGAVFVLTNPGGVLALE